MTEQTGSGSAAPAENAPPPAPSPEDVAKAARAEAKESVQNSALRERLKAAEAAAAEWKKHQESQKSEAERWAGEKASLETRATTAERELLQYKAAAAADLPLDMAARLQGATLEEMTADAKELAKRFGSAAAQQQAVQAAAAAAQRSRPDPTQGQGHPNEGMPLNGSPIEDSVRAVLGMK